LRERVPEAMQPSIMIIVREILLTTGGKLVGEKG
jgi:hypothetical protein